LNGHIFVWEKWRWRLLSFFAKPAFSPGLDCSQPSKTNAYKLGEASTPVSNATGNRFQALRREKKKKIK
jgi:hypothetical protein